MARHFTIAMIALSLAGCVANLGDDDGTGTGTGDSDFALISSTGEQGVLRRGDSLALRIGDLAALDPETMYRYEVAGAGGAVLAGGDVRTDREGQVYLATIMHDVGEDGRVSDGDDLVVTVRGDALDIVARTAVRLGVVPNIQRPGYNVDEPEPPHIFASNAAGEPTNAFAVGGAAPGEPTGPVHVAGEGFPESVVGRDIDVYVATDRDEWRGRAIPHEGDAEWIAGPITAHVSEAGVLAPTAVFSPDLGSVGIYDILVDVDRDGTFEWSFDSKDAADGLGRVGFTIQYSAAWLAARESSHILVNIAYNSNDRDVGQWQNGYSGTQEMFFYLNPPVMHQYHFSVTKWIVRHQDFDAFWNNPAAADDDGAVQFAEFAVMNGMDGTPQTGCTNELTPYGVIPLGAGETEASFDVVYDRNGDGRYMPGEDLLDIISGDTAGDMLSVEAYRALPAAQRVGLTVRVQ